MQIAQGKVQNAISKILVSIMLYLTIHGVMNYGQAHDR
jgi:hypothetical protein